MNTRKFLTILAGLPVLGLAGLNIKEQKYTVEMTIFNQFKTLYCRGVITNIDYTTGAKPLSLTLSAIDKKGVACYPPGFPSSPHYFSKSDVKKLMESYKDGIKEGLYKFNITAV